MEDKVYERLKEPLKKRCIYMAIACIFGLFATIFMLFLPVFAEKAEIGGIVLKVSYSPFQDMKAIIGNFSEGSFGVIMLIPYIYLIIGTIMIVVDMIKSIMHIFALDEFALETYDKLKNGQEVKEKRRGFYGENPGVGCIVSGLIVLIIYKVIFFGWGGVGYAFNGVSGWIVLPALFLIGMCVFSMIGNMYKKNAKKEILKDKYLTKEEEQTEIQ